MIQSDKNNKMYQSDKNNKMAPRGSSSDSNIVCKRCSKDVKFYVTCVECGLNYHPSCVLKIIGSYVDDGGNIVCCKNITSKLQECEENNKQIVQLQQRLSVMNETIFEKSNIFEKSVNEQEQKDGRLESAIMDACGDEIDCDGEVVCDNVGRSDGMLKLENDMLKKLIYHLEKRTSEQEEIIILLKSKNVFTPKKEPDIIDKKERTYSDVCKEKVVDLSQIDLDRNEEKIRERNASVNKSSLEQNGNKNIADEKNEKKENKNKNKHQRVQTKRSSNKPIIGDITSEIKTLVKRGHLHVDRLGSDTSEEDVLLHLRKTLPDVVFECELLRKCNYKASFRVTFPLDCISKVYKPSVWPAGAAVRRFVFRRTANFRTDGPADNPAQT